MNKYQSGLFLLALLLSSAHAYAQELVKCSTSAGGAKTNCENSVFVSRADHKSDFRIHYDLTCRKVFSNHVLVFANKAVTDLTGTTVPIEAGSNREITLPNSLEAYFGFKGQGKPLLSQDCSLIIRDILKLPSEDQIALWKLESKRLSDLLESKAKLYQSIKDYDNLIEKYSIPKLEVMAASLQTMVGSMLDFSLNSSDSDTEILPANFGINAARWETVDLEAVGLISRAAGTAQFLVTADRVKHRWYFSAFEVLPAVRGLVVEVARVKGAVILKEQAAEAGFEIPNVESAKQGLEASLSEAKEFLARLEAVKEQLGDEFRRLQALSQQYSEQG
ncbi:MAG TPA: hypothetical protein VE954_08755 [Oligoflexus sp.]|uniref:hypothetical protein n=1 Tax=Oligoflexus sp. TaxID=1971216 RepID=UPI002D295023|nr:hypothetical protein [Oligoflexus sp.]HYX33192.1 hypothetical protein [Oligoflexus sp.]